MSLHRRLKCLETRSSRAECPGCGMVPGEPLAAYEVLWHDTENAGPVEPEWCATCGRQTAFVVGWGDIDLPESVYPGEGIR